MDNDKLVFREVFKGYNKSDVISYIESLNRQYATLESDYKSVIASQKEQLAAYEVELGDLRSLKLDSEADTERDKIITGLNDTIDTLKAENEQLNLEISKCTSELEEFKRSAADAETADKDIYEKARLYDRISGQLGDILLSANERADAEIERIRGNAIDAVNRMIAEARESLKSMSGECLLDIQRKCDEAIVKLKERTDSVYTKITNGLDEINTDEKI